MDTPYVVHQDITAYVHMEIYSYIKKNKGKCKVYESPIDIQLDRDDKTMVEPDKKLLIKYDCSKEDAIPEIKPLKGKEPVLIYDGKLEIDLDEIEAIIDEYELIPEE